MPAKKGKSQQHETKAPQAGAYGSDVIQKALKRALMREEKGGFLHLSIDNLPMIISSQGGDFAEKLMAELVEHIERQLEKKDKAARIGHAKIGVILYDTTPKAMENTAHKLHTLIQNYGCTVSDVPIHLIATLGGVDFPRSARNEQDILNRAYIAFNDAKESYRHYAAFGNTKKHEVESRNQLILANYIQSAMLNHKLRLAFQPIVSRATGETEWYECLLRIVGQDGTISSAGPFIPIAEKMGFIDIIDTVVMQMVIEELKRTPDIHLAFNVSNSTVQNTDWLSMATRLLSKEPSITPRMTVEITETAESRNIKQSACFVNTMQDLGCKVALDDFGAGHTSFAQVKHLPIDVIKIDGSFVRDIVYNPESRMFVKTLVDFSHNLGLQSVAEFVENAEIAELLREMGVDYMQGNYFSPAVNYRAWDNTAQPIG